MRPWSLEPPSTYFRLSNQSKSKIKMIDPEKYETNKSVAARDAAEFVPKLMEIMGPWTQNENILDYGCGAGSTGFRFILPQVEKFNSNLYSVDISEKMVEFAKVNYSHPRITYGQGDIVEEFPFPNVKFDKIFSIYVFHFIPDMRNVFKRFLDILRPGGQLGFTAVSKSFYMSAIRELGECDTWKDYLQGYKQYVPEWLNYEDGKGHESCQNILQQAGFDIVYLEVQKRSFPFENIDTLLGLYLSLNPLFKSIPEELQPRFQEHLRKLITGYAGIPSSSREIISEYECVVAVIQKPIKVNVVLSN